MVQAEKFIEKLYLIAAQGAPLDRQTNAVAELFARFVKESQESSDGDPESIRGRLTGLQFALTMRTGQLCADYSSTLPDYARQLVTDWLRRSAS